MAIGFSLGSNILVKYLGEEGEKSKIDAAVSVSNPFDFIQATRTWNGWKFNTLINYPLTKLLLSIVEPYAASPPPLLQHLTRPACCRISSSKACRSTQRPYSSATLCGSSTTSSQLWSLDTALLRSTTVRLAAPKFSIEWQCHFSASMPWMIPSALPMPSLWRS